MKTITTACLLLPWTPASVQAFLPAPPLTAGGRTADRRILRALMHGTIGNDDFAKIFGNQEAAERRTRELASEYRRPPKRSSSSSQDDDGNKRSDTNTTTTKNPVSIGATTNTTKAVQKPSAGDEQD